MAGYLPRVLFLIVIAVVGIDALWLSIEHFDVDISGYLTIASASLGLAAVGLFYVFIRKDARLSAMLLGTSFLIAFSAAFAVLNYFLLTIAGPRIDNILAAVDRAMGVDWPAMMAFAADHPKFNFVLLLAYRSVMFQIAFLIACLGWRARSDEIISFCLALAAGAAVTVTIWTLSPSFGAFSVYELPANVQGRLTLALDSRYAHELAALLTNGPGRISPNELKGLIGFPSFHIVLAILVTWYARSWKVIFLPLSVLNTVVLVSTPIQGGHHVIDLVGGIAVAALAIKFVAWLNSLGARDMAATRVAYARTATEKSSPA